MVGAVVSDELSSELLQAGTRRSSAAAAAQESLLREGTARTVTANRRVGSVRSGRAEPVRDHFWVRRLRFLNLAFRYSLFISAMKSIEIDFGHAFSHSPWFVQEPKYSSIVSTMASTRL